MVEAARLAKPRADFSSKFLSLFLRETTTEIVLNVFISTTNAYNIKYILEWHTKVII